ncbi:histone family protein [Methanosphaera sp. ISO3-F5]|uniref:histone family protein n=1 Tax=Methanosphaera sp. ISO3-F5 TaxID=1452353 RepID=UPI002B25EC87|nr:histone family protein [Methanosphaera sp. ISO3-F5]WQH63214.1 histone family protein [Methanosphaera sp. ISO3-F5]
MVFINISCFFLKKKKKKNINKMHGDEKMSNLPLTPLGRIIKSGGAERVSEDAKVALSEFLEDISQDLTKLALENAEEQGRKTLKAQDIEVAYKKLF